MNRAVPLLLAVLLAGCNRPSGSAPGAGPGNPMDTPQSVEVSAVEERPLEEKLELVGSLEPNESAEIRAELAGVIRAIRFEEGRPVKKDEPLIELDTRELEAQIAEASARVDLAEKNYARAKQLMEGNAISRTEYESAEAASAQGRAALRLLEVRREKSILRAPFDGVAGARSVSVGDYLTPEAGVTSVADVSRLKISLDVPERFLAGLQPGSTFTLGTAATGDDITGEVYFVAPSIDPQTRSAEVKGFVKNPPAGLRPGMFANVSLVLRRVETALVVPETAVLNTPNGSVVIAAQGQPGALTAAFIPVRLGLRVPGVVQVTPVGPPLAKGDLVVSSGVGGLILIPGMKLIPVDPLRAPGPPPVTDRTLKPQPPEGQPDTPAPPR
jgi:membrane fusion protein (multidrug efflux system)